MNQTGRDELDEQLKQLCPAARKALTQERQLALGS